MKKLLWIPIAAVLFMSACGEEIARIPVNKISTEASVHEESVTLELLKGDELAIWSLMDMSYQGDASMAFSIIVMLNDESLDVLRFDPREKNVSMNEVKTELMGDVNWRFTGKNGEFNIEENGTYTFKAVFIASENVSIEKAEIIIKK